MSRISVTIRSSSRLSRSTPGRDDLVFGEMRADSFPAGLARPVVVGTVPGVRVVVAAAVGLPTRYPAGLEAAWQRNPSVCNSALSASYASRTRASGLRGPSIHCLTSTLGVSIHVDSGAVNSHEFTARLLRLLLAVDPACAVSQLEHVLGPLTGKQQQLVQTLEVIRIEHLIPRYCRAPGRPPKDRGGDGAGLRGQGRLRPADDTQLLDRLDTDVVLRRICGWERKLEVPSESVFSRAFAEFAATKVAPARATKR